MSMELVHVYSVQQGLGKLVDSAFSIRQNLEARVNTPVLKDDTDIWKTRLDSRTITLNGGTNEDGRYRFKIDNDFDLSLIVDAAISLDGSVHFEDDSTYTNSEGTEFIIIPRSQIKGAQADYAIRADKYAIVREQLYRKSTVRSLKKAGAFEINRQIIPDEVPKHDGWLELAVGRNKAREEDYVGARDLVQRYVSDAEKRNCFSDGTGMGFFINTSQKGYKARPWYVNDSEFRSSVSSENDFYSRARFLRIQDIVYQGDELKVAKEFREGYEAMLAGEPALRTPYGYYVLTQDTKIDPKARY